MVNRSKKLATIHIAKKQCGLGDEEYRALLLGTTGVSSAREINTDEQYKKLMEAFGKHGFKSQAYTKRRITDKQISKCYALWCRLYKHNAVKSKKYSAMMSWIYRQLGSKQDIIRHDQKSALIEDLKNWLDRVEG